MTFPMSVRNKSFRPFQAFRRRTKPIKIGLLDSAIGLRAFSPRSTHSMSICVRVRSYLFLKGALTDPAMRYFKQDLAEYQKGNDHVTASLRPLEEIAKKLAARRITFEVFRDALRGSSTDHGAGEPFAAENG